MSADARQYGKIIEKANITYAGRTEKVPIRFDGRRFAVEFNGEWYQKPTIQDVKEWITAKLTAAVEVKFQPFIRIHLSTWNGLGRGGSYSGGGGRVSGRDAEDPVIGFSLQWDLLMLSDPQIDPWDKKPFHLERPFAVENGMVLTFNPLEMTRAGHKPEDLIPYTPKTLAALEAIAEGIRVLHGKLTDLCETNPQRLAELGESVMRMLGPRSDR